MKKIPVSPPAINHTTRKKERKVSLEHFSCVQKKKEGSLTIHMVYTTQLQCLFNERQVIKKPRNKSK